MFNNNPNLIAAWEQAKRLIDIDAMLALPLVHIDVEQGTEEWLQARSGGIGSTAMVKIMAQPQNAEHKKLGYLGLGAETALNNIAVARASGVQREARLDDLKSIQWGRYNEDAAAEALQERSGLTFSKVGLLTRGEWLLDSADRIADTLNEPAEFKCPYSPAEHNLNLRIAQLEEDIKEADKKGSVFAAMQPDHYTQCHHHMLVTGAKFCHFGSYDPDLAGKGLDIAYIRIPRNEEKIQAMKQTLVKGIAYISVMEKRYRFMAEQRLEIF